MSAAARPIRTLLIANRGEIAVRIARTARRLGIRTVAVYSDEDTHALHVSSADVAVRIGGATPAESYLDITAVIAAAKMTGADAIHPGYGFLSENPDLADACAAAGVIFVGPSAAVIRAMGDKAKARRTVAAAGVPVVPGYDGEDDFDALAAAATRIGYPLLIKPAAGGGGKGMRIVERLTDLPSAWQAAKREAKRAFGDDRVIIERYLAAPRHVEVQIIADGHGNALHLLDRDCSVQRRYQKVIEEAPAPALDAAMRADLRQRAVTAARAVNYVGAGTVEFLVAEGHFFFMEMNTRLQVEHPVTEAVTGLDLVERQIRIAEGVALPMTQEAVVPSGHAMEARLLAEDPGQDFVPQAGLINRLRLPEGLTGVRVDAGVREGDRVSVYYDPLIAKIIAHGADRGEAIARLRGALAATIVGGITTNRTLLMAILAQEEFLAGPVDTGFLVRHREELLAPGPRPCAAIVALAAFAALRLEERTTPPTDPNDPYSPWNDTGGWRLFGRASAPLRLAFEDERIAITVAYAAGGYALTSLDEAAFVSGELTPDGTITARVRTAAGEQQVRAVAVAEGDRLTLFVDGIEYPFRVDDPRTPAPTVTIGAGKPLASPMPGQVVAVMTAAGKTVAKGEALLVVEAMKMEHTIAAPRAGRIAAVTVVVGDRVAAGIVLVRMDEPT